MKKELRTRGILSFDDAYLLALDYLGQFPKVKTLLQKRFRYIFVDEMQDMNQRQYEILEKLFFDDNKSLSVFQRIGDKNQAIFNGHDDIDHVWTDREKILHLEGSFRLTLQNANVVKSFGFILNEIQGRRKHLNGSEISIKPHILVFDNHSIRIVISKFAEIIKSFQSSGQIPIEPGHQYKAIGWVRKPNNPTQIGISDFFPEFLMNTSAPAIDYSTLEGYSRISIGGKETLEALRKNILNALLKILRLENITCADKRDYTKRKMLTLIKDDHPEYYEELKLKIYQWSIGIIRGQTDKVLLDIIEHIPVFLSYFE